MKKFFIALSVLAALMLGVAPAQAQVAMPDDVPGSDAIVPFVCATNLSELGTGLNTMIIFTEISTVGAGVATTATLHFEYDIMTVKSETVYDGTQKGTGGSITSLNAKALVAQVSDDLLPDLEITIDGVTYYAGYIYYDDQNQTNNVLCEIMFVDLAKGMVGGSNVPMLEWNDSISALLDVTAGAAQANMAPDASNIERFSADGLASAMALQNGDAVAADQATLFGLYPRFHIAGANDKDWIIMWQSENANTTNNLGSVHIDFYRDDEESASTNIKLPNELNVLNVYDIVPRSLWAAGTYPIDGWINLTWDDDATTGNLPDINVIRDIAFFGFNLQIAQGEGTGAETFAVLNSIQRRASYQ